MHDAQSMNIRSQTFAHTTVLLHALKVAQFSVPQYLDHQEEVDEPEEDNKIFNTVGPNGTFTDFAAQDIDQNANTKYVSVASGVRAVSTDVVSAVVWT